MSILDLKKPTDAAPLISPEDAAAYMATLKTPVAMPEQPADIIPNSIKEISQAYKGAGGGLKGGLAATLSGLGSAAKYLHTSSGQKIMAGLVGGNMMPGFLNNAENAKAEEQRKMDIARASQQSRFNAIGDLVREQGKELGENKRAAEKNATDIEVANIGLKRPGIAEQLLSGMQAMKSYEQAQGTNKAESEKNVADLRAGYKNLSESMTKAKDLNLRALGGSLAKLEQGVARLTGVGKGKVADTTEMKAIATSTILPQLKQIFGGNPTEGEREILLQLQGADETLLPEERERLFNTALEMAANRVKAASEAQQEQFGNPKEEQTVKAPWKREWKK